MADESMASLQKQNKELSEKLLAYKRLEEDLLAQRVFEKAKKKLSYWITLGGVFAVLAGFVGFREVVSYGKNLAKAQVAHLVKTNVADYLRDEGHKQVASTVQAQREEYILIAKQQIQLQLAPIGSLVKPTTATISTMSLDYSQMMLPVRDMGNEGASVAFAVAAALEYQIKKTSNEDVRISPRYIYYLARAGPVDSDSGAVISAAIRVVTEQGAVTESVWPYIAGEYAKKPPDLKNAKFYKIKRSRSLISLAQIKEALKSTGPVVAGITVHSSFMTEEVKRTGVVPLPAATETIVGGHAICLVGFDDGRKVLKFLNEWGPKWGDRGYGYLPYAFISNSSADVWAISM